MLNEEDGYSRKRIKGVISQMNTLKKKKTISYDDYKEEGSTKVQIKQHLQL
jgi:hypothetical protein